MYTENQIHQHMYEFQSVKDCFLDGLPDYMNPPGPSQPSPHILSTMVLNYHHHQHLSIDNITGKYKMNKKLSLNIEHVMRIQKVPWVARKLLAAAPPSTMVYEHSKTEDGHDRLITIEEVAGIASHRIDRVGHHKTTEELDSWAGPVRLTCWRGRKVDVEADNAYLRKAWDGLHEDECLIFASYETVNHGWTLLEVTSVQEIEGEKRVVVYNIITGTKPEGEIVHARVVYDPASH